MWATVACRRDFKRFKFIQRDHKWRTYDWRVCHTYKFTMHVLHAPTGCCRTLHAGMFVLIWSHYATLKSVFRLRRQGTGYLQVWPLSCTRRFGTARISWQMRPSIIQLVCYIDNEWYITNQPRSSGQHMLTMNTRYSPRWGPDNIDVEPTAVRQWNLRDNLFGGHVVSGCRRQRHQRKRQRSSQGDWARDAAVDQWDSH
jgi:hypothetical protein